MRKFTGYLVTIGVVFLIILAVFNYRYPFSVATGGAWSLGFGSTDNPLEEFIIDSSNVISFERFKKIAGEESRFIADPFLFIKENKFYIFFEHQLEGYDNIGLMVSEDGENYEYKGVVLDENFHLSFPQIFENSGRIYMLPETKEANHVLLYESTEFPYKWEISDTLIKNVQLKDPSILLTDDLILITASDDKLRQHVYTADSLHGEWKNSKKFKGRRGDETRPGGSFFEVEGEWYLPFQNNSQGYGTGLSLYKLDIQQEKISFEKVNSMFLKPHPDIKWFAGGMHHLDVKRTGEHYMLVYDGRNSTGNTAISAVKASIKYNLYDLQNFFLD